MAERAGDPFAAYLDALRARLGDLTPEQRDAITREVRAHLEDAASDLGRSPADPGVQEAVIRRLGPGARLGREMARVYRREREPLRIANPGRFWALWVLASVIGWSVAHPAYAPLSVAFGGVCAALLHTLLLQRQITQDGWWKAWAVASCGPWIACAAVFGVLPWARFTEPVWEVALFYAVALVGATLGLLQWLLLRRRVAAAGVWMVVPLASLMIGWLLSALVNGVVVELYSDWLTANRRFEEMFFLLGIFYGVVYGAISGGVLVGLARLRGRRRLVVAA